MLDPLTAVGLAASVVQLVGSSYSFVSACQDAYRGTSSNRNIQLQAITEDLEKVNEELIKSLRSATISTTPSITVTAQSLAHDASDKSLIDLAKRCQSAGEVLLRRIYELRITSQDSRWKVFRTAVKTAWTKDDIDAMAQMLDSFRDQLQFHLLASLRSRFHFESEQSLARWNDLDLRTRDSITLLMTSRDLLMQELQAHSQRLQDMQSQQDNQSRDRLEHFRRLYNDAESNADRRHDETKSWLAFYADMADQRNRDILAAINASESRFDTVRIQQRVLQHLTFETMDVRRDKVAEVHAKTFQWIFETHDTRSPTGAHLMTFLESGTGCYWLNGKAGSGKSTLMKLLTSDYRTTATLRRWTPTVTRSSEAREDWAPPDGLVLANFFFWHAGSHMQKSQLGLLQTFLHSILSACPALISLVLPKIYEEASNNFSKLSQLSFSQIKAALMNVVQLSAGQFGVCLFIDGLDEYDAGQSTHAELADFLLNLCHSNKIKAVVSSRPLPVFEHIFRECPQLRLQDLTKPDIDLYVHDRLRQVSHIDDLMGGNPKAAKELIDEITSKAAGVFLWVALVVKSIVEGLYAYDSVQDLRDRLEELPDDLDELYMHMLKQIPARYRQEASQMLQMASAHLYYHTLTVMDLSFALEPGELLDADVHPITEIELVRRVRRAHGRIKSLTFGLLEIYFPNPTEDEVESRIRYRRKAGVNEAETAPNYEFWRGAEVYVLHTTAYDFLLKPAVQQYLHSMIQPFPFNPLESLLRSSLLRVKTLPHELILGMSGNEMGYTISLVFHYALQYETETGIVVVGILDELGEIVLRHRDEVGLWGIVTSPGGSSVKWGNHASFETFEPFVGMALRHGLVSYFLEKLAKEDLSTLEGNGRPLLFSAVTAGHPSMCDSWDPHPSTYPIQALLAKGADPNAVWHGMTPWAYACAIFHNLYRNPAAKSLYTRSDHAKLLHVLIEHGVDADVLFEKRIGHGPHSRQTFGPIDAIEQVDPEDLTIFTAGESDAAPLPPQSFEKDLIYELEHRGGFRHKAVIHVVGEHFNRPVKDFWTTNVVRNSAWGAWRLANDPQDELARLLPPAATAETAQPIKAIWFHDDGENRMIEAYGDFEVFEKGVHNTDRWPADLDEELMIYDVLILESDGEEFRSFRRPPSKPQKPPATHFSSA